MKRVKINLLISIFCSFMFIACKGSPETPPNNVNDRGHDMPDITTYTFVEGSLSDVAAIGKNDKGNENRRNYLGDGFTLKENVNEQTILFKHNSKGELVREGKFIMKPDVWYKLNINFINKSGVNINYQFVENEKARSLHQFFFRSFLWEENVSDINRMIKTQISGEDNVFDFRYGDKFADGSLIDPPIGFVGYIKLNGEKAKNKQIDRIILNGILVHVMGSSKLKYDRVLREKVPYSFDDPSEDILGVTDIDHRFEVDFNFNE